jgi:hypothetical protein
MVDKKDVLDRRKKSRMVNKKDLLDGRKKKQKKLNKKRPIVSIQCFTQRYNKPLHIRKLISKKKKYPFDEH